MTKLKSKTPRCPSGYILRESYKSGSGKLVSARCIKKTGLLPGGKSMNRKLKLLKKAHERSQHALTLSKKKHLSMRQRCPAGMTLRSGYTRKSYTRKKGTHVKHGLIPQGCIKTRGKSRPVGTHKSRVIVLDPEDHYLSKYGYFDVENKSKEERMTALNKFIEHFNPIKGEMVTYNYLIKALNARYVLNRNTNPKIAKIFKADQNIISKKYNSIKNRK